MAGPSRSKALKFTIPGVSAKDAGEIVDLLQDRLNALNDLALTLKHIHWNVVGPNFIGVHTMLDPQVDAVRDMADTTAERIATLGGSPCGTPGALVAARSWQDYSLGRDDALAHMGALDLVYAGVIEAHRKAIEACEDTDPVTQDMLINQAAQLELQHWFVRAHLENPAGSLSTAAAKTETQAASRARH
jgi:starvation-inducible DNA-binding protein